MTQEKNNSGLAGCCLYVSGTQAALVDDASIPQFSKFHVFVCQLNRQLNKLFVARFNICPQEESPTRLTSVLANQGVIADLSCDMQELELEHSVPDEAYKMDGHI